MDPRPLVTEQVEAGAEFARRFSRFAPVQAAFWLNPSEEGRWRLYLVSDQLTAENVTAGYLEVFRLLDGMKTLYPERNQVRLLRTDEPLGRAVLDFYRRYPTLPWPYRYRGPVLGDIGVEEALIYPPGVPADGGGSAGVNAGGPAGGARA
jgi:hypothetical protein